jgi:hypothetical protein
MAPITRGFVEALESFARSNHLEVVTFEKKQRKEDVEAEYLRRFRAEEGLLFVGKAQEKARVFRTERRRNPHTGASYAWLYRSTAMVRDPALVLEDDPGPLFASVLCTRGQSLAIQRRSAADCAPWLGGPASGVSSPSHPGSSTRVPGGSARRSAARSLAPPEVASTAP